MREKQEGRKEAREQDKKALGAALRKAMAGEMIAEGRISEAMAREIFQLAFDVKSADDEFGPDSGGLPPWVLIPDQPGAPGAEAVA